MKEKGPSMNRLEQAQQTLAASRQQLQNLRAKVTENHEAGGRLAGQERAAVEAGDLDSAAELRGERRALDDKRDAARAAHARAEAVVDRDQRAVRSVAQETLMRLDQLNRERASLEHMKGLLAEAEERVRLSRLGVEQHAQRAADLEAELALVGDVEEARRAYTQ